MRRGVTKKSLTRCCKFTPNKKHNMSSKKWAVKTECVTAHFETKAEAEAFAIEMIEGEDAIASDQVEIIAPE